MWNHGFVIVGGVVTCSMDIHFTHFAGNLCISFADCHTNRDRCIPNTPCVFMFLFTLISLFSTPLAPHTDSAQVFSPTFIHYLHVALQLCVCYMIRLIFNGCTWKNFAFNLKFRSSTMRRTRQKKEQTNSKKGN